MGAKGGLSERSAIVHKLLHSQAQVGLRLATGDYSGSGLRSLRKACASPLFIMPLQAIDNNANNESKTVPPGIDLLSFHEQNAGRLVVDPEYLWSS
jgi:hypothetical protein